MSRPRGRSRLFWILVVVNVIAVAIVAWITIENGRVASGKIRVTTVDFSDLPGWSGADTRAALKALARSCAEFAKLPQDRPLGGLGYAGSVGDWRAPCGAISQSSGSGAQMRSLFEHWFAPLEVTTGYPALFTGYYEPELAASRSKSTRFRVPLYGRPNDLVTADLSLFRRMAATARIYGHVTNAELVPYPSRAEIDSVGLKDAPILLYTDDPVRAFFLSIQGSGRARFEDGTIERLAFAGTNGRRYTSVGRVLIARGAIDRQTASLQTIRDWLHAHPADAQDIMEQDQSYVFFALAPLGDPGLGSPGTEGVPLEGGASLAVDSRIHPLGIPVFVATTIPGHGSSAPERPFEKLLVAQDTGGDIKGAARGDIFFGSGDEAEYVAGHLKAHGRFFVLVPKPVAAALSPFRDFSEPPA